MRKILAAAFAASTALMAGQAGATAYVVGPGLVQAPGAYQLVPLNVGSLPAGTYADSFIFTLTTATALTAANLGTQANTNTASNLDFSTLSGLNGVTLRRFNTTQNLAQLLVIAGTNTGSTQTGVTAGNSSAVADFTRNGVVLGDEGETLQGQILQAGSYAIVVNYTITAAPATYNGNINFSNVSNVPEPASWGMMILGLGMIGAAARRRRGRVQTTFA